MNPITPLKQALEKNQKNLPFIIYSIGDCVLPRSFLHAIHEGFEVAYAL